MNNKDHQNDSENGTIEEEQENLEGSVHANSIQGDVNDSLGRKNNISEGISVWNCNRRVDEEGYKTPQTRHIAWNKNGNDSTVVLKVAINSDASDSGDASSEEEEISEGDNNMRRQY